MDEQSTEIFKVLYEISGCGAQRELAAWLECTQAALSDARRRNRIPVHWLMIAACKSGMSPAVIAEKMHLLQIMNQVYSLMLWGYGNTSDPRNVGDRGERRMAAVGYGDVFTCGEA